MLFRISHKTRYRYDPSVFIEPMTLRLTPRSDSSQKLLNFSFACDPNPTGQAPCVDLDGNNTQCLWFDDTHNALTITTQCEVQTLRSNPFDYVISDTRSMTLPMSYPDLLQRGLVPYQQRVEISEEIDRWAQQIARDAQGNVLAFLTQLTAQMHGHYQVGMREEGEPLLPRQTFEQRFGACRDVSVLFMDVCRSQNLAARFVSGYSDLSDPGQPQQLHAWVEVYLPGGGWRAYDPSLGLAVADQHVALAAGADPLLASPVSGTYRGTQARTAIEFDIRMTRV